MSLSPLRRQSLLPIARIRLSMLKAKLGSLQNGATSNLSLLCRWKLAFWVCKTQNCAAIQDLFFSHLPSVQKSWNPTPFDIMYCSPLRRGPQQLPLSGPTTVVYQLFIYCSVSESSQQSVQRDIFRVEYDSCCIMLFLHSKPSNVTPGRYEPKCIQSSSTSFLYSPPPTHTSVTVSFPLPLSLLLSCSDFAHPCSTWVWCLQLFPVIEMLFRQRVMY